MCDVSATVSLGCAGIDGLISNNVPSITARNDLIANSRERCRETSRLPPDWGECPLAVLSLSLHLRVFKRTRGQQKNKDSEIAILVPSAKTSQPNNSVSRL